MPQSLANILVHLVFSTKDRVPWIADDWREDLHAYMGGIIRRHGGDLLAAGSAEDHVHLLFPLPRTAAVSELVRGKSNPVSRVGFMNPHHAPPHSVGNLDTVLFLSARATRRRFAATLPTSVNTTQNPISG